jgi:hypothetical protein
MGMPSWARIEFPYAMIDADIREYLEREGVEFRDDEIKSEFGAEITLESGLFSMENNEAAGGEFEDLETMLVQKGIPFDRETGLDWNCPPVLRVFRPGGRDITIPLDFEGDPVVKVAEIWKIAETALNDRPGSEWDDVEEYLSKHFPAYPPLADYVEAKEAV